MLLLAEVSNWDGKVRGHPMKKEASPDGVVLYRTESLINILMAYVINTGTYCVLK